MNQIAQPSQEMSADVAALLGNKDKDGIKQVVKPKFDFTGLEDAPALNAHEKISPADDKGLRQVAKMLVDKRELSVTSFLTIAQPFDIKQSPVLNSVLVTMKNNQADVFGRAVLDTNYEVRRMKDKMPALNPKIAERIRSGAAKPKEVINFVVGLVREIQRSLKEFDNVLAAVDENEVLMEEHFGSAYELVLKSVDLAVEQDGRTEKLLKLLALVDWLRQFVAERMETLGTALEEKETKELLDESEALKAVSPLILRRLQNIPPMVLKGNINEERFTTQAQMNALNALDLRDYIDIHLFQVKTDIVTGLLAIISLANMFAVKAGIQLAEEVSEEADEKYAEQVNASIEVVKSMLTEMERLLGILDNTISAGDKLHDAFTDAAKQNNVTVKQVGRGLKELKVAEANHRKELTKLMREHGVEVIEEPEEEVPAA